MLFKISIASSGDGCSTNTFWKRLSKAPSFSMCILYSSNVEAPIHCNSPLAKAGLKMLEASNEPLAPPAPTMVWISSMNKITSLFFSSSFIMAFMRSSNWPRYLVPATKAARSRLTTRLSNSIRDTFLCTIRSAKPSTMAVLPTPGSPIKIGLFFFRRDKIWETLSISFSLPTIGSRLPFSAMRVMSLPKLSNTGVLVFGWLVAPGLDCLCCPPNCFLSSSNSSSSLYSDEGGGVLLTKPDSFLNES